MPSTIITFKSSLFTALFAASLAASGLIAQDTVFVYITILFFSLASYFVFQRDVNLFNPFTLFTIFYFTIIPAAINLHMSDFKLNIFLEHAYLSNSPNSLLQLALLYYIFGYWFALLGYRAFAKKGMPAITLKDGISIKIVNLCILVFAAIGIINFCYNVIIFAGGNLWVYISNISIRHLEYEQYGGGTTLGYLFCYLAAYLWLYKILKLKKISYPFFLFLGFTICMHATTGRISGTLFYALSFISVYYLINFNPGRTNNIRYIFIFALLGCLGLLFYLFRTASSLSYNNMLDAGWIGTMVSYLNFESVMQMAAGQGNIPNVAIFMQIIDSWGRDIGFLYGETLVTWIYSMIPSSIRPEGYQVSVMIKDIWHAQTLGGNLPPTGVGEMYANFGMLGPFFGMFLFGGFVAAVHNMLFKYNNYWYLVIFTNMSLYFVMLYPKGEFDNLSFWHILPILVTYYLLKFLTTVSVSNGSCSAKCLPQLYSSKFNY